MNAINQLIAASLSSPKRICVVGEAIEDIWISGEITGCQDACPCFKETGRLSTPGGAAGAVRQLVRWPGIERYLIAPLCWRFQDRYVKGWEDVPRSLTIGTNKIPTKYRWMAGDKIVFRSDECDDPYADANMAEWRYLVCKAIETMKFDGILISDYDKGFLDKATIARIISFCNNEKISVVADAKRQPDTYVGSLLKCNNDYAKKYKIGRWVGLKERIFTRGEIVPG